MALTGKLGSDWDFISHSTSLKNREHNSRQTAMFLDNIRKNWGQTGIFDNWAQAGSGLFHPQDERAATSGIRLLLCAPLAFMTREHALLTRMRQTPFGWGQDDFRRLYRAYGFDVIEGRRHIVVRHPRHPDLATTVARHQELPPAYARTALRPIDELLRRTMSHGAQEDHTL